VSRRASRADIPIVGDERHVGFRVPGVADQTRLTPIIGSDIIQRLRSRPFLHALLAAALSLGGAAEAQEAKIRDLTIAEGAAPIRLVGYGLAVGLDGTGDRTTGGAAAA
jgi:hypothetical protein